MNKIIAALLICVLGAGTASAYLYSQLKTERARGAELESRIAQLEHSRAAVPAAAASEPVSSAADVTPQPSTPQRSGTNAVTAGTFSSAAILAPSAVVLSDDPKLAQRQAIENYVREKHARQQQALMNDPEYRDAMLAQMRISIAESYSDLAKELGISQDQANRLLDLLAEQQLSSMGEMQPVDPEMQSDQATVTRMRREMTERHRVNQEEIAQTLGSDGMQRWQDYQNSMGTRWRVRELGNTLQSAGVPLREDQHQPLRQAFAASEKQNIQDAQTVALSMEPGEMTRERLLKMQTAQLDRMAKEQERLHSSLVNVLSPEQLEVYERRQAQQLAMQRAQLRVMQVQGDSNMTIVSGATSAAGTNAIVVGSGFVTEAPQ